MVAPAGPAPVDTVPVPPVPPAATVEAKADEAMGSGVGGGGDAAAAADEADSDDSEEVMDVTPSQPEEAEAMDVANVDAVQPPTVEPEVEDGPAEAEAAETEAEAEEETLEPEVEDVLLAQREAAEADVAEPAVAASEGAPADAANVAEEEEEEDEEEVREEEVPTTSGEVRPQTRLPWFTSVIEKLTAAKGRLQEFTDQMLSTIAAVTAVFDRCEQRLGAPFTKAIDPGSRPSAVQRCVQDNQDTLGTMIDYVIACADLESRTKLPTTVAARRSDAELHGVLRNFVQAYQAAQGGAASTVICNSTLQDSEPVPNCQMEFTKFCAFVGERVFREHVLVAIGKWTNTIMDSAITVCAVRDSVMKSSDEVDLIPNLAHAPTWDALLENYEYDPMTCSDERPTSYGHAVCLLQEFCEELQIEQIILPNVHKITTGNVPTPMAVTEGLHLVNIIAAANDVGLSASWLHKHLLLPMVNYDADPSSPSAKLPPKEDISSGLTACIMKLHGDVQRLDDLLESRVSASIEQDGWRLPTPLRALQSWRESMSVYGGVVQRKHLLLCVEMMKTKAAECTAATPQWRVCIVDSKFDEVLAVRTLAKLITKLARAHNDLHSWLQQFSEIGEKLKVTPRLQDHELTGPGVKLAMATLAAAAQAHVVCAGVELLIDHAHSSHGPQHARDFIAKYKARHSEIPATFWAFFENWSQNAFQCSPELQAAFPKRRRQQQPAPPPQSAPAAAGPPAMMTPARRLSASDAGSNEKDTAAAAGAAGANLRDEVKPTPVKKGLKRFRRDEDAAAS